MKNPYWNVRFDALKDNCEKFNKVEKLSPLASLVLQSRDVNEEGLDAVISKEVKLHDPMLLKDMDKAVKVINEYIQAGELICIYGDYDCDGVCATAIIKSYFEAMGVPSFYYIPHRGREGYGLNKKAIDEIIRLGATLIITVDNGISAIDEIDYANSCGIKVVITDHHTPRETLPNAAAIVNPHQKDCGYPFKNLCGAGVAFKLLCALEGEDGYELLEQYCDILAIATLADVVELKNENRSFVNVGIEALKEPFRPGVEKLFEISGIKKENLTAENISFGVCPRINAAGRMDSADTAAMLLLSEDINEAEELAAMLDEFNNQRRAHEKKIIDDIDTFLLKNPESKYNRILFFSSKEWNPGVVGIVCSRLVERFGKPALLAGIDENGLAKGSGRSVEGFSLINAITACSEKLTHFGGHPMAAGFSLKEEDIASFSNLLEQYTAKNDNDITMTLSLDAVIPPELITVEQVESLSVLEPFGCGNEYPLFELKDAKIMQITPSKDGKHTKISVEYGGENFGIMCFFTTSTQLGLIEGDAASFAVTLSVNDYMGKKSVTLKCIGAKIVSENYLSLKKLDKIYESFLRGESVDIVPPTREDAGEIYRFIKINQGKFGDERDIFLHMKETQQNFLTFRIAMDVLYELKLLTKAQTGIELIINPTKMDWKSSQIIRSLNPKI